jgi:cell division transport system permease protein
MEMGENPSDFLGYNPLLASFEVSLNAKYANNDSIHLIENFLKEFPEIESIVYQKDAIDLINTNIARIGVVLGVAALVLLFISIVLIHSTIRLMIYADRFLIKSMRLVGATSWFIRKPYIKRSMLDGFIASLLAIGYIAAFVYFLWHSFELNFFVEKPLIIGIVAGVVVLVGVILTAILAFFAVGKFLRMKSEKIYLI